MPLPLTVKPEPGDLSDGVIRDLVVRFYARVQRDPDLGPIFEQALTGRWDRHFDTMVAFWSSVALRPGRYHGKPHAAHADLALSEELFARWLELFASTAREVCPAPVAALFIDRAARIAESLQIGLGIGPKALRLPLSTPVAHGVHP